MAALTFADLQKNLPGGSTPRWTVLVSKIKNKGHRVFFIGHHEGYLGPYFIRSVIRKLGFDSLTKNCNTIVGPRMFSNVVLRNGAANVGNLFVTVPSQKTTAILVTHDREEALVSSDVIALMRDGKIMQQGSPEQVYSFPTSATTAMSTGDTLVLQAKRLSNGDTSYLFNSNQFSLSGLPIQGDQQHARQPVHRNLFQLRPEPTATVEQPPCLIRSCS